MKLLKWLLIALGTLLVLAGSAAAIGAFVPLDHSASMRAVYHQSPETVWALITDFPHEPSWRPEVREVERGDDLDGHTVWIEKTDFGSIPLEVTEKDPPRKLVMRIAGDDLPFGGTWTFDLAPHPEGTSLTITERGQIYNPMFRFMARFVFGYEATLDAYLKALGLHFDEEVVPVQAG